MPYVVEYLGSDNDSMSMIQTDRDLGVIFPSIVNALESDQSTGCDAYVRHSIAQSSYE